MLFHKTKTQSINLFLVEISAVPDWKAASTEMLK